MSNSFQQILCNDQVSQLIDLQQQIMKDYGNLEPIKPSY